MSEKKKKAAIIAAVKVAIEVNRDMKNLHVNESQVWSAYGKQTIMTNRNFMQSRNSRRKNV